MPLYEYKCSKCGHQLETIHKADAEPLKMCPKCDEPALEKLVSGGHGILFLGHGWTDNGMSVSNKR